jgi:hypothetical protein
VPTRQETLQLAFEAIHKMDRIIFPNSTATPTDWDAVALTYHEAARIAAIALWRHFVWLADPAHRYPTLPILGANLMLSRDIVERLANAKLALMDFEKAITDADPTAVLTWETILKSLSGMVNNVAPVLDHLLLHFSKAAATAPPPSEAQIEKP